MKNFNIKNLIWFFIFFGLGILFAYFLGKTMEEINTNYPDFEHKDYVLLRVLFSSFLFLDFGFFIASFWNLYICIKSILKKEENK
ncbi:MAG: hypothetical protein HPAVJP_5610 [Candidatus Hepatoplasma vulgare]|nr:MAG: hypothetical protein HPAVJP_5610 [Candidatus Hepatoplasma sp.]